MFGGVGGTELLTLCHVAVTRTSSSVCSGSMEAHKSASCEIDASDAMVFGVVSVSGAVP